MKVAVLGAGAFGTALAIHLRRAGHEPHLWTRQPARLAEISAGRNEDGLPGMDFEPGLSVSADEQATLSDVDLAVLATPSHAVRETVRRVSALRSGLRLLCVAKGLDPATLETHSQIAAREAPASPFCVLTGPSFAREVVQGQPTALVAASRDVEFARDVQSVFSSPRLRVYESDDVAGAEMAGALKNVIAIAAGMLAGLRCGENTRAALITRGLAEIARVVAACGGRAETVSGLAGLGDLVLTCSSNQSRNFQFGRLVAEGREGPEVLQSLGTVEGFRTATAACVLGERAGIETPIAQEVRGVLVRGVSPQDAIASLMLRRLKREVH